MSRFLFVEESMIVAIQAHQVFYLEGPKNGTKWYKINVYETCQKWKISRMTNLMYWKSSSNIVWTNILLRRSLCTGLKLINLMCIGKIGCASCRRWLHRWWWWTIIIASKRIKRQWIILSSSRIHISHFSIDLVIYNTDI